MNYDQHQLARMVHEIIIAKVKNELGELSDKYNLPVESIEKLAVKLYVEDISKSQWKSSKAKFIKLYEKELEMLFDNNIINFQELGFMVFLALKFTQYEDNALRNSDGTYSTQKDIITISGMTKPTVSRLLKGLIDKKLIFERKHETIKNGKCYMITPYIFYKGKMIDSKLKDTLKKSSKLFIETWQNNNTETDNEEIKPNLEIDTDNFIGKLEEEIVNSHAADIYIN